MKAIMTNYRYWVLTFLGFLFVLGLLAMPDESIGLPAYIVILFGTKLMAFFSLAIYFLLYLHWQDNGEIPELTNLVKEEE